MKLNQHKMNIEAVIKQYPDFENTFNRGFIGIPTTVSGLHEPFYGTLEEAKEKLPEVFQSDIKLTTVFYMEGSGKFSKGVTFRKWIAGEAGHVFLLLILTKERGVQHTVRQHLRSFMKKCINIVRLKSSMLFHV